MLLEDAAGTGDGLDLRGSRVGASRQTLRTGRGSGSIRIATSVWVEGAVAEAK